MPIASISNDILKNILTKHMYTHLEPNQHLDLLFSHNNTTVLMKKRFHPKIKFDYDSLEKRSFIYICYRRFEYGYVGCCDLINRVDVLITISYIFKIFFTLRCCIFKFILGKSTLKIIMA